MRLRRNRTTVSIATAFAVVCGVGLMGAVTPASAVFGEADIDPVESNLAAKPWAAATASGGESSAPLAVDGDPSTAWIAEENAAGEWLTVDLGGAYDNVR